MLFCPVLQDTDDRVLGKLRQLDLQETLIQGPVLGDGLIVFLEGGCCDQAEPVDGGLLKSWFQGLHKGW